MPKQSFLSTDFFVIASEAETIKAVLTLPAQHSNIHLLRENVLLHSMRFLYEHREKPVQAYIDVSILPLNEQYVRISLHGSYTNGKRIHSDPEITAALQQFEKSVCGLISNEPVKTNVKEVLKTAARKSFQFPQTLKLLFFGKQVGL